MHIVTAADSRFLRPLAVMLKSIERTSIDHQPSVTILSDEPGSVLNATRATGLDVRAVEVPEAVDLGVKLPSYLTSASLFRLLISRLVPADVDRVIYLDADTLVRQPLSPLWELSLDRCVVGAVRDPLVPWFGAPFGPPWEELGIAADSPYFNSGVMLIDLATWRQEDIGERCLATMRAHTLPHADQCALNTELAGAWLRLRPIWNLQAAHLQLRGGEVPLVERRGELDSAILDPCIVHFNSSRFGRPWLHDCTHPYRDEWLSVLDETDYAGWRPSRDSHTCASLARAAWSRLRRSASVLLRG